MLGKRSTRKSPRQVGHVEHDEVVARPLQLGVDGARHHVARREVLHLVVARHERGAVAQAQDAALAAHRLRDQERLRGRVIEAGRVELEELHVRDARAHPVRHRDAVAGRDVGVRRVEVDLARAAGGQHHRARDDRFHGAGRLVQQVGAEHGVRPAVLRGRQQIDRHVIGQHRDAVGAPRDAREQRLLDRPAGRVLGVDDAAGGVAALAPERQVPVGVAVERDARARWRTTGCARAPRARRSRRCRGGRARRPRAACRRRGWRSPRCRRDPARRRRRPARRRCWRRRGRAWSRPPPARARPRAARSTGPPAPNR